MIFMECGEHVFTVCGKNVFHVLPVLDLEVTHLVVIHFFALLYVREPIVSRHSTFCTSSFDVTASKVSRMQWWMCFFECSVGEPSQLV